MFRKIDGSMKEGTASEDVGERNGTWSASFGCRERAKHKRATMRNKTTIEWVVPRCDSSEWSFL